MFEYLFLAVISLYFIQLVVFAIGANKKFKKLDEKNLPSVSVIVAARNEQHNILRCLTALDACDYEDGKLEIIIVNDHSEDNTAEIIDDFIKEKQKFSTFVPVEESGNLKGKANAIHQGVLRAKGEVVLMTDADCAVSESWIKSSASYFTEDVSFVGGYTNQIEENFFSGMQSVDFIYLLAVASGAMNLGKPLSCIGNNMAFRKECYLNAGGYEKITFSVTEDFQLLMALHKLQGYKTIYPTDNECLVTSEPCKSFADLYSQKKRWGVGGLKSDLTGFAVMAVGSLASLGIIMLPLFFTSVSLYLALFKIFSDLFFLLPVYRTLNLKLSLKNFIAFEVYFVVYVFLLPFIVLFDRRVNWKGRTYN